MRRGFLKEGIDSVGTGEGTAADLKAVMGAFVIGMAIMAFEAAIVVIQEIFTKLFEKWAPER